MPKLPITRRKFIALSAGTAAAATLGPWTKVYAAPPPTVTVLDEAPGTLINRLATLKAQGHRPLSVAIYGSPTKVATTFIQRTGPDWDLVAAQTKADLDIYMWVCWFTGYRLTHLAATGSPDNPIFIAASEASTTGTPELSYMNSGPESTVGTIQYNLMATRRGNFIPTVLATWGSTTDPRYAMTIEPNPDPDRIRWNAAGLNETLIQFRNRLAAHTEQRARPGLVQISPGLTYTSLFRADEYPSYPIVESDLTKAQLDTAIANHKAASRYPVHITANTSGAVTRFAAIFTGSETIVPRQITRSGANRSAEIDQVMIDTMSESRLRHATLAIVNRQRRLVYCRSFKLAEAGYKEVSPTSHFRLASVSKTLTSMLALEIIQNGGAAFPLRLDTPVQSVLNLRQPDGSLPVAGFENITVEHILRHVSGMGNITRPEDVAAAFNTSVPITRMQLARWACAQPLSFTPGNNPPPLAGQPWPTRPLYSNVAFVVLAQLIETITLSTFQGALRNRILTPLGATRVRVAPGLIASHPADEAAYECPQHNDANGIPSWALNVGPSVITAARPMVPFVYGADLDYRYFDGPGGLSAAAPDLAKIFASLGGNGLLNETNRDRMLVRGGTLPARTPDPWSETRIGFDSAADGAGRSGEKGGWFLGTSTVARYNHGSWSFVLLFNSSQVIGNPVGNLVALLNRNPNPPLADNLSCLFPTFGIPSF